MSYSYQAKTHLFVDGSNLYGSQYDLFGPNQYLDFVEFVKLLEKLINEKFSKIYFYASYSPKAKHPTKKEIAYLKNEGLFYRSVKRTPKAIFFKGYRSITSGKEKEVDVKLAVDMVDFAHRNKYNRAYLISGDADFLHALFAIMNLKKFVGLICIANHVMYKAAYYVETHIIHLTPNFRRSFSRQDKSPKHYRLMPNQLLKLIQST